MNCSCWWPIVCWRTHTQAHTPPRAVQIIKELYQISAVSGPANSMSYSPAPRHQGAEPETGGGPGEMDTHLNSRTPSASEWEEVSHLWGKEDIWLAAFWSSAHLLISRVTGQEETLKALKQLRQEVRVPWSIPWEMSFIWDLGEGEKLWKPFEVNDLCI